MHYMDAPFTYYVKCKIYDTLMDLTDRSACTVHRASSTKRAHRADAYETNMLQVILFEINCAIFLHKIT